MKGSVSLVCYLFFTFHLFYHKLLLARTKNSGPLEFEIMPGGKLHLPSSLLFALQYRILVLKAPVKIVANKILKYFFIIYFRENNAWYVMRIMENNAWYFMQIMKNNAWYFMRIMENNAWYFMQNICTADDLHEIWSIIF